MRHKKSLRYLDPVSLGKGNSAATCVIRGNREADASWVHCQEGQTVDTGYGKEDYNSLCEKNKSTAPEDSLALEESPRKGRGSLSW